MILTSCSTGSLEELDFDVGALSKSSHVQMHMDASTSLWFCGFWSATWQSWRGHIFITRNRRVCQSREKSSLTVDGGGVGRIKWQQLSYRHRGKKKPFFFKFFFFIKNSNRCHTGFWEAKQMTGYSAVNRTADDGRLAICPQCVRAPVALACFWDWILLGTSH